MVAAGKSLYILNINPDLHQQSVSHFVNFLIHLSSNISAVRLPGFEPASFPDLQDGVRVC